MGCAEVASQGKCPADWRLLLSIVAAVSESKVNGEEGGSRFESL